jgi:small conductance mechanosensitive channel
MDTITEFFTNPDFTSMLVAWGTRIVIALVIFIVGRWVAKMLTGAFRRFLNGRDADETLVAFLGNLIYMILLTVVVLASLDYLGMPVTSLVAVLGAAGLAIGLALKDSLGNFASGVMLVMFRPFSKGDLVEVGGVTGKVQEIRIFSTILNTNDNKLVIIPNGQVGSDTITNYTANEQRRVDLVFGVGYDDDLKVARSVLETICKEHELVLDDPATNIFVMNLGDSCVEFVVRPWVKTEDYWTVYGDLLETGKVALEAAGCSIPYPQTDVHLHKVKSSN